MAALTFAAMLNNANTTITQAMTVSVPANGGQLTVTDGTVFSTKGYALIDSELIHYDSVVGGVLNLNAVDGRGAGGTTVTSHIQSTTIYADIRVAAHINELAANSPNVLLTAKGGIITASAANTPTMLAIGADGQALMTDSSQATGLKYALPSSQFLISNQVVSVATYFIDFLNVPQTYRHLMLILNTRCDTAILAADNTYLSFNGDAGANCDAMAIQIAQGGLATTEALAFTAIRIADQPASAATANSFSASTVYIPDYTSATKNKSAIAFGGLNRLSLTGYLDFDYACGVWKSNAAITRVTLLTPAGSNFVVGSRATLYGLI